MSDPIQHLGDGTKHILDALSVGTLLGTLFSILPGIASLLTVVWMLLRIFDWIEARVEKRRLPKD